MWEQLTMKWSSAFFWLFCLSCSFLTTENSLCTCSNWVLNDKHLASPENCSIKSQPQLWGSTILESLLRGVAFPVPKGRVLSPLAPFHAWTLTWTLFLAPNMHCSGCWPWPRPACAVLHPRLIHRSGLDGPEVSGVPNSDNEHIYPGEEMEFSICYSPLLFSLETNAKGTFGILFMIW